MSEYALNASSVDAAVIIGYFVVLLAVGLWQGRKSRASSGHYFFSKGTLPWWAIGMAYVAAGMNTEQLVGQNGMGYTHGLVLVNWYYTVVVFVYSALIFVFFPIYLRNNVRTMPEFLGRRFGHASQNVFAVMLLGSYIFLNLAVVFYGGAKVLQVIFPLASGDVRVFGWVMERDAFNLLAWLVVLATVAGIYTMYGGMSSMIYTAAFQFVLIFGTGFLIFYLGYIRLPNGWADVVEHAPGGFHLIQPANHDLIPWQAIILTLFGLQLFYSCMNQAMVQRGFGARTEWDVRIAVIFCGFFVLLRPFLEIFPGMIARALAFTGHEAFDLGVTQGGAVADVDLVFPLIIRELIPRGLQGLVVVGILSSVMSTIAAFLNSISTLFTFDVYKKWFRPRADDKELIRVGTLATLALMVFAVVYSPVIEHLGGIFIYFQAAAANLAVPVATVFLFGIFWKRSTPVAALTVLLLGIPIGVVVGVLLGGIPLSGLLPWTRSFLPVVPDALIDSYSLDNFFVESGVSQIVCSVIMVVVSLMTQPRPEEEIASLLWSKDKLFLPPGERRRPWYQSVCFWWLLFVGVYGAVIFYLW